MMRVLIALAALALPGAADPDPLAGYVAGEAKRCVVQVNGTGLVVLDANRLSLRASGRRTWVVQPDPPCGNMHPTDTLIVERFSGQLCRGDRVRVLSRGMSIPSGSCRLGMFVPYDKQKQ